MDGTHAASLELILYHLELLSGRLTRFHDNLRGSLEASKCDRMKIIKEGFMLSTLVSMVGDLFGGMLFLMYLVYSLLISCGLFFGAGLLLVFTSSQLSVPRVRYGHHCRGNCEMETINLIDAQNKYIPPSNQYFWLPKGPFLHKPSCKCHPWHCCHVVIALNWPGLGKQVPRHRRLSRTSSHQ